jgi:hypothetical protein
MNGKKFLDQRDIDKWVELLEIPANEINEYFFVHKVHAA